MVLGVGVGLLAAVPVGSCLHGHHIREETRRARSGPHGGKASVTMEGREAEKGDSWWLS